MSEISQAAMASTTELAPSWILPVTSQGTPEARSTAAVPSVARSEKPRRTSSRAMKATARLSWSFTEMKATPPSGSA